VPARQDGGVAIGVGIRAKSPATPDEVALALPGDDLVPDASATFDRASTLPVTPAELWPWLVQLGKGRGGWYFPAWLERLTPPRRRGLRHLDPALQQIEIGDDHPDWGPGRPVLRVVAVDPHRAIVYHSLRDKAAGHRWPPDGRADRPGVLAMSWALVLTPVGSDSVRLHLRVRIRLQPSRLPIEAIGDLFDRITVDLLVAGLRERVTPR
jgi:hypothetical protein